MGKQLAVMKGVGFGVRDMDHVMLWFEAKLMQGSSALICVRGAQQVAELLERHQVSDTRHLEGKTCVVDVDGMSVNFVDLFKDGL